MSRMEAIHEFKIQVKCRCKGAGPRMKSTFRLQDDAARKHIDVVFQDRKNLGSGFDPGFDLSSEYETRIDGILVQVSAGNKLVPSCVSAATVLPGRAKPRDKRPPHFFVVRDVEFDVTISSSRLLHVVKQASFTILGCTPTSAVICRAPVLRGGTGSSERKKSGKRRHSSSQGGSLVDVSASVSAQYALAQSSVPVQSAAWDTQLMHNGSVTASLQIHGERLQMMTQMVQQQSQGLQLMQHQLQMTQHQLQTTQRQLHAMQQQLREAQATARPP